MRKDRDIALQVIDRIVDHFKTGRDLGPQDLTKIISEVVSENNAFEKLDECDFFGATQITV